MYKMSNNITGELFESEHLFAILSALEIELRADGKIPEDYGYEDWSEQDQEIRRYLAKGWHWYTPNEVRFEIWKE